MARLEAQESTKYYKWLFWIEHIEFKKELLEIVSILFYFIYLFLKRKNISTIEISIPDINFDIPTPWTHFGMTFNLYGFKRILYMPDEVAQIITSCEE